MKSCVAKFKEYREWVINFEFNSYKFDDSGPYVGWSMVLAGNIFLFNFFGRFFKDFFFKWLENHRRFLLEWVGEARELVTPGSFPFLTGTFFLNGHGLFMAKRQKISFKSRSRCVWMWCGLSDGRTSFVRV